MVESARAGWSYGLAAALASVVLWANAPAQFVDSNFLHVSEAVGILAGDHPYRDFFASGTPLAVYASVLAQWLAGYRLIGEFFLQWSAMVLGAVVAFHIGLHLSRSMAASWAAYGLTLLLLAYTPSYHYTKLLIFPIALWCAWRYLDRPGSRTAVWLGVVTAVAFLLRHDYLIYVAVLAACGLFVAALGMPVRAALAQFVRDSVTAALVALAVVAPWLAVVEMNEGIVEYIRSRTRYYEAPGGFVYATLLRINPVRDLAPDPPPPTEGVVAFIWNPDRTTAERRPGLERRFGLTPLGATDAQGRQQYKAANIYDTQLLELDGYINDGAGFEWERLQEIRWGLPPRDHALRWLTHVMLLIPVVLAAAGARLLWQGRLQPTGPGRDGRRLVLAGVFLIVIDSSLFRQPSYLVTVAPITAALGAWVLARTPVWARVAGLIVLLLCMYAAVVWTRDAPMYRPARFPANTSDVWSRLVSSPPESGHDLYRHLRDCTADSDHLIVTGSTPFDVNYYADRPIAGGHLVWHFGLFSDPEHEARSLALLERQSVPFAISTTDPVMADFNAYPRIRTYLETHFRQVEGYGGKLLVNATLQSARGASGSPPCFE